MINIEECSLCSFEENLFAPLHGAMEIHHRTAHEWAQFVACRQIAFIDLSKTDRLGAQRLENSVVLDHFGLQFFREHNGLHQIGHPQARARCLITISRANHAFDSSNSGMASTQFPLLIEQAVVRQNQESTLTDE